MDIKIELGDILKLIRISHFKSVKEVAELSKVSSAYICDVEAGKKKISISILEKLSQVYGIKTSQIMLLTEYSASLSEEDNVVKKRLILFKILEMSFRDNSDKDNK